MIHQIHTPEVLKNIPDGTIISWLRIPGDPTSAAVAFVHSEIEQEVDLDGRPIAAHTGPIVWISPGGWQPMTIDDAGITYPAEVIRWGDLTPSPEPMAESPSLPPLPLLPMIGGMSSPSSRQVALKCAAQRAVGNTEHVLEVATAFEKWLDR